jgi:ABC-type phosphate transport system substrate-binding protein
VPRAEQPAAVELTGAGSTFDAPFFSAAFARYHQLHPAVSVS